jgi:hypothetical protein
MASRNWTREFARSADKLRKEVKCIREKVRESEWRRKKKFRMKEETTSGSESESEKGSSRNSFEDVTLLVGDGLIKRRSGTKVKQQSVVVEFEEREKDRGRIGLEIEGSISGIVSASKEEEVQKEDFIFGGETLKRRSSKKQEKISSKLEQDVGEELSLLLGNHIKRRPKKSHFSI